jgi:predicted negative regulator of RcsB-dependent stress response
MSLKDNVDYVKGEISSEEKFLESFVKVERFYKKNKMIIVLAIIVALGIIIGLYVTKSIQASNKLDANIAFSKVLENPKDTQALNTLKEKNEQLFQVAKFIEDKNYDIQVKYLKEISEYKKALDKNDIAKLNSLSMQNDFLLKEFAIFNKALLLTKQGKYEDAKVALKLIPENSQVNNLANILKHYLVTK